VFVLVRHAHAGDKKSWPHADEQRPLSELGWQQAEGLAENLLTLMRPAKLIASPYLRCTQTLAPLARRAGIGITTEDLLAPGDDARALDQLLRDSPNDLFVYCTHGETLNALLARWAGSSGWVGRKAEILADGEPVTSRKTEKGAAWLVLPEPSLVVHYLRPLHVGPAVLDLEHR